MPLGSAVQILVMTTGSRHQVGSSMRCLATQVEALALQTPCLRPANDDNECQQPSTLVLSKMKKKKAELSTHTPPTVGVAVPDVRNFTTFSTLFKMTLSSSVIVGSNALALTGTMLKTGAAFPIPKDAAIWINCSLEIASMAFTICSAENKKALVGNFE